MRPFWLRWLQYKLPIWWTAVCHGHVPHCTVLLVSLQVQERSMDIYLHEILFMLCFLYHFDSFTLDCLGMKPWDITCTSKFYCNSWAASTYHVMLHKVSFLATSQFCAWRPLYDLSRQKHNSEIIENEIENVELGALLLLCFVINMNFCKLIDCVIFSHTFVRFAFYCLILIKGKFNKTIISAISVAIVLEFESDSYTWSL